ncbi:hypothetical protein LB467_00060 [Salegentibacter sp. JZCK2]|uniref:hypothetical protein n=1 Tax=Salegentibacter tibetensis TaxID=2873600 RepID=UPI001CC9BEB0|nr:hypothetical protein [Salegentibacter tibetensis]MBZ9728070.1 hypothetical protein [Salegentibacter tibetensis]
MKRYDIELFVKSTLREYTLTPKRNAWLQLLDKLQEQEQKRDQKIFFRKAVLLITVFLAGFGTVRNKSIQHLDISLVENSGTIIPTADTEVEKGKIVSLVTSNNAPTYKNEQVIVQEKIPQRDVLSNEVRSAGLDEVLTANKRAPEDLNLSPGIEVTDAEIESLMREARKNIDIKRILLEQQEILLAREFLVDAIDIEEEREPKRNNTEVAFNSLLRDFLKIKSAFAN